MSSSTWGQPSEEMDNARKRWRQGVNGWRPVGSDLRRKSSGGKGKLYKAVVRAAMMYCLQTVALSNRQKAELEVAEDGEDFHWD